MRDHSRESEMFFRVKFPDEKGAASRSRKTAAKEEVPENHIARDSIAAVNFLWN
jgi:hypothetical protein